MDGIFGIGLAEMVIIVMVLLVIGGPRNTVKWARELGKMVAQLRKMWTQMVKELEKEMGDDAKELVKVTKDITRNVNEIRTAPQQLMRQATKTIEEPLKEAQKALSSGIEPPAEAPPPEPAANGKYNDWLPKE